MGPASSSRNLPMQKIFSLRQKTKALAFEEFIGKIAIENPRYNYKRCFSLFYSKMSFIPIQLAINYFSTAECHNIQFERYLPRFAHSLLIIPKNIFTLFWFRWEKHTLCKCIWIVYLRMIYIIV
jgi:hypothetical protein